MSKCTNCKKYQQSCNAEYRPNEDLCCSSFKPKKQTKQTEKIKQFDTGAYRDTDDNKLDFEACFSPLVLKRYAEYIQSKRKVPIWKDKGVRPDDNWQVGIPIVSYMKSKARHFVNTWLIHRGFRSIDEKGNKIDLEESLCAELFNTQGYLFEILKEKNKNE